MRISSYTIKKIDNEIKFTFYADEIETNDEKMYIYEKDVEKKLKDDGSNNLWCLEPKYSDLKPFEIFPSVSSYRTTDETKGSVYSCTFTELEGECDFIVFDVEDELELNYNNFKANIDFFRKYVDEESPICTENVFTLQINKKGLYDGTIDLEQEKVTIGSITYEGSDIIRSKAEIAKSIISTLNSPNIKDGIFDLNTEKIYIDESSNASRGHPGNIIFNFDKDEKQLLEAKKVEKIHFEGENNITISTSEPDKTREKLNLRDVFEFLTE